MVMGVDEFAHTAVELAEGDEIGFSEKRSAPLALPPSAPDVTKEPSREWPWNGKVASMPSWRNRVLRPSNHRVDPKKPRAGSSGPVKNRCLTQFSVDNDKAHETFRLKAELGGCSENESDMRMKLMGSDFETEI